jgi:A/G-specific adenine glycosylase
MKNKKFFVENLINWNRNKNKREMPWKGEHDPYKIWVSEIILQQTRVQQGLGYYNRFIKAWPDIKSLASAREQEVYKLWEGLGYYSRCRNMIETAKYIDQELDAKFPDKYEDILALKGIGIYTAAAISSFAFNQPYAVVDGNVNRILARFFGIRIVINDSNGKKIFASLADGLIDKLNPAIYNQSIMDFGAVICKPALPLCEECPLQKKCVAHQQKIVNLLPVKENNIRIKHRFFNYLVIKHGRKIFVNKRIEKDIWQNLFEFPLLESDHILSQEKFLSSSQFTEFIGSNSYKIDKISNLLKQKLTHQLISGRFFHITLKTMPVRLNQYKKVSPKDLATLPFPKFISSYLKD